MNDLYDKNEPISKKIRGNSHLTKKLLEPLKKNLWEPKFKKSNSLNFKFRIKEYQPKSKQRDRETGDIITDEIVNLANNRTKRKVNFSEFIQTTRNKAMMGFFRRERISEVQRSERDFMVRENIVESASNNIRKDNIRFREAKHNTEVTSMRVSDQEISFRESRRALDHKIHQLKTRKTSSSSRST